ncbi:MAG TPA: sialate O-acetylesterase [Woeseiaceae bacterium]|nr:sialate O-acetylesterase [Woeseiaceae bacterium]
MYRHNRPHHRSRKGCRCACLVVLLLAAASAGAEVELPRLLGDGVILQRDQPVVIWGRAADGERVQVFLDGVRVGSGRADDGHFRIDIGEHPTGGPHRIIVAGGDNRVTVDDAWFGDVWVAGGQSNMELTMERVVTRHTDAADDANFPLIREFKVPRDYDFDGPRDDFASGEWKVTTPATVLSSSAVAYYFARELHERYDVPIGIVSDAYGGSAAESWMSEAALAEFPHYLDIAKQYRDDAHLEALLAGDRQKAEAWLAALDERDAGLKADPPWSAAGVDHGDWATTAVPGMWDTGGTLRDLDGAVWFRRTVSLPGSAAGKPATMYLGRIDDMDTAWVNGVEVGATAYMWPPRIYPVPAGVLAAGDNVIAVRVVDANGDGGFVPDKEYRLAIGEEDYPLAGDWHYRVGTASAPQPDPAFVTWRQPLGFYNAMLAPLRNFRIRGVIWYQGETNVGRGDEYAELFPAMIRDWRRLWRQGDFPFLFVQLANYLETRQEPGDSDWAELREAQRRALRLPNTAMVVTIDVGEWNDIHPLDKQTVGERLARAAQALAYGESDVVSSGPMFRSLMKRGGKLVIEFDHVGGGLQSKGGELTGFAVAGEDGRYVWADARIDGETVVVASDAVADPTRVRYAWADNPEAATLYNDEGLPASPFEASITGRHQTGQARQP